MFYASAQKYQDTQYFTKEIYVSVISDSTTIYLYEKGDCKEPHVTFGHGMNPHALYQNIAVLLEKEFPTKPDPKIIDMIKDIQLDLVYNGKGEIRFYKYRMSPTTYSGIPDLERKLYHFITAFKTEGLLKYDLRQGTALDSCSAAGCGFKPAIKYMWQSEN